MLQIDPLAQRLTELPKMTQALSRLPNFSTGELNVPEHGIGASWVAFPGSFADCLPAWNSTRTVCLIFSGEVFNTAELNARAAFESGSPCNAMALVHLYEEHGPDFLLGLNGRFSGLLIDRREDRAILFNDRFGANRIYFHQASDGFYFASEAKALLALLPQLREIDQQGLAEFFSVGCVLENRSLYRGISLLPPSSRWTFHRDGRVEKLRYFQPSEWEGQEPLDERDYAVALQEVFGKISTRYLQGQLGLGMSLTGGLDSRMLLAWTRFEPGTLPCYTFGGPYRDCWDLKIARELAEIAQQPHTTIRIEDDFFADFPELARETVELSDGTMDVSGAVELYVNRKARQIAPVRLTGNYGSEILRSNVAFRPGKLDYSLYTPEFSELIGAAEETYRTETEGHRLSFIAFKQVPWHHHGRFSIEQSQLIPRSPFLDNDLVALAYRVPKPLATSPAPLLELISAGNPALERVRTDRSLSRKPWPVISALAREWQEFTAKAEYAYDYGMPQRMTRVDHILAPLKLEKLFLGRHKFYHFRIWYKTKLREYLQDTMNGQRAPACYREGIARKMIQAHIGGTQNHTVDLHRLLSASLTERQLTGSR